MKNGDNISFLGRSNDPKLNAGTLVKEASTLSLGNGGGSPTFAQGGGKTTKEIDKIFNKIIKDLENE